MRRHVTLFGSCLLVAASALAQQASTPAKSATAPVIVPPQAQAPANPITDAQAHELLELTGAAKMREQLSSAMPAYFQQRAPFLPKDVVDDLVQSLTKVDVQTPVIALYKQHISTTDAAAIIAFYKTPAGQTMIHTMPAIMAQSERIGVEMGQKTAQEVFQRHHDEIDAAAKKYQAEHMAKPAPSLNSPSAGPSSSAPASKPQQ